ncbi:hypothetical protein [Streptomyces sp. NPDC002671]
MSDTIINAGSKLNMNQEWASGDGRTVLRLQDDRNLVLYRAGEPTWAAKNTRFKAEYAIMQDDGNFVAYDQNDDPVWASNTGGSYGAHLAVQDDGNLVVYQDGSPLWATDTGD